MKLAPARDTKLFDAPWEGHYQLRPWDFKITAVIPVIDPSLEVLTVILDLWRWQTEPPFIVIVDTGSESQKLKRLQSLRSTDLEVHSIGLNAVQHPSDFVAMAMEVGAAVCRTSYMFCTHDDVFAMRHDLLEDLLKLTIEHKVVGYERAELNTPQTGFFSHSCLMLDMDTYDRVGGGWSQRRLQKLYDRKDRRSWPDPEFLLNMLYRDVGIKPLLIGTEPVNQRTIDTNIDHCRAKTSVQLYFQGEHAEESDEWLSDAVLKAKERVEQWKKVKS